MASQQPIVTAMDIMALICLLHYRSFVISNLIQNYDENYQVGISSVPVIQNSGHQEFNACLKTVKDNEDTIHGLERLYENSPPGAIQREQYR